MISWKIILYSTIAIGFLVDIFDEGLMSIGIIVGWLVGLLTATEWEIRREEEKSKLKKK